MEGFTWLEIYWAVLNLYQNIGVELSIQGFKLVVRLLGSVFRYIVIIHKGSPHNNTMIRA
jgi:hypothetical protein